MTSGPGRGVEGATTLLQFDQAINSPSTSRIHRALEPLPAISLPEMWTCFWRLTLVSRSSRERVTIDRRLSVRPMSVSKVCLGSVLLTPGLKYKRFKAKLMAIEKAI